MSNEYQEKLAVLRSSIDEIDARLLNLLNERANCAQQVGHLKAEHGEANVSYRPEREAQILRRLQASNPGPLANERVAFFFREIMSACLALEQPVRVAFLGPSGTFSESAALRQFGHAAQYLPQVSIDEAFHALELGHVDYAVVPIENSTEGAIGRTLDLLIKTPLKICGEVSLRIEQHFLSKEASLSNVQRVYSHAQSLAQCQGWLRANLPGVPCFSVSSNAEAARKASSEPGSAAIAGERAAEQYQLPMLVKNIEDEPNNTTRFVVLGKLDAALSGCDKTSLVMSVKNQAGALSSLLTPFSEAGVSMTHLESRPIKNALWEYVFFVDILGHREDEKVKDALNKLEARAAWVKILGSYPVSPL